MANLWSAQFGQLAPFLLSAFFSLVESNQSLEIAYQGTTGKNDEAEWDVK